MRKIAIITYNNAALFELGCAVELFALPRPEIKNWYQTEVISLDQGPHNTSAGLQISSKYVENLEAYDTLIIPSWPTDIKKIKGKLADEIKQFHNQGKHILSFCSGAFLLAAIGILDNCKATTHWRYSTKFKKMFPLIEYVGNVLYTYDGILGCSAGSAAAIDLGIEVIRQDYGTGIANQVAKRLVMSPHRKGGQSQYVDSVPSNQPNQLADTLEWALNNLHINFTVNTLADYANMSRRTFDRKFRSALQITPKEWITLQRLNAAKELLEQDNINIELIADQAGFDNAATMRHNFRKVLGVSPRQYRDQFSC